MERITQCPDCAEKGEESILYVKKGGTESGEAIVFYDEKQKKHVHDPTVNYIVYECSKGHKNIKKSIGICPACGLEGGEK